eukprot:scaffold4247_cov174-Ochromonas_danica.AAC.21
MMIDQNNLVDSLEFISALAMLSGMTPEEKTRFVFAMYDFGESASLTVDEMVLAYRSSLSGACKLCRIDPPTEREIEDTIALAFDKLKDTSGNTPINMLNEDVIQIDREAFIQFTLTTPDIFAWLEYFDDLTEYQNAQSMGSIPLLSLPNDFQRNEVDEAYTDPTLGGLAHFAIENDPVQLGRKPWQNVLPVINPAQGASRGNSKPLKNLTMEWIYGYNASDCKHNLYYSAAGEAVYPAGAICVIQNIVKNSQRYFSAHNDMITALALFITDDPVLFTPAWLPEANGGSTLASPPPSSANSANSNITVVASGERGWRPTIYIWETTNCTVLASLTGFHRGGISRLDFSPNRQKLVSMGMDPYHSIAVYNWRTSERTWASRTTALLVLDARFITNDIIATCGDNHIFFWKQDYSNSNAAPGGKNSRERYIRYRGQGMQPTTTVASAVANSGKNENVNLQSLIKLDTLFCVGIAGKQNIFTTNDQGFLQVWEGRNMIRAIKAHTGSIETYYQAGEAGIVTACSMGKAVVWNGDLEIVATFSVASLGPVKPLVSAICFDSIGNKMLIGFVSSEIFEMDATDGRNLHNRGAIVTGHFHHRICGVVSHPLQSNIFCTVGDDKSIRIFDCIEKKQVRMCLMDCKGHCVTFNNDGRILLVGVGSGVPGCEENKEGGHILINAEDLTILHEARDCKQVISDCKFSPDGEKFALSSYDGSIYLYKTKNYANYAMCRGHEGRVSHIDFSSTSSLLMSNSLEGELLFWDVQLGQMLPPKQIKGSKWQTNSCVFTRDTQSFVINKSTNEGNNPYLTFHAACKSHSEDIVFAVDNFGTISAAQYPCYYEGEPTFSFYTGHGKGIRNCAVSCDDCLFFSVGENDGSIIQWRIIDTEPTIPESELKRVENSHPILLQEIAFEGKVLDRTAFHENVINHHGIAVMELEEGVHEPKPLLPWQQIIVPPSKVLTNDHTEPPDSLVLDHVHGLTIDRSRESLFYTPKHELAYFGANIGILMNQQSRRQRFYQGHTSTITAMAVNFPFGVIATGEQGRTPAIQIWSLETLMPLRVLKGYHRKAINHLKFSSSGELLLSVGQDIFHSIAVYDWRNSYIICCTPSFVKKSFAADFFPNGAGILHCGQDTIRFYNIAGRGVTYQDAMLSPRAKVQGFMSIAWIGSSAIVGTTDGSLYRFLGHKLESIVQAHNGIVNAIASAPDGVCSGGSDGLIKIWTRFLECRLIVELKHLHAINLHVRCIDWDFTMGRIIVATAACEVFEISAADGENIHSGPLVEGHSGEELWGLSINLTKEEFCTVGDDALLRIWDLNDRKAKTTISLELPARCCAYSPDGKHIAIGFGAPKKLAERQFDGKWIVIDTIDYQVSHEARDSNKWLRDIKYSPNGQTIAIGGEDMKIYVYNVTEGYALNAVITQHQSFILAVDFSDDSNWIRSNCGGCELLYFEAETGLYIPAASRLRDISWASQQCSMEWAMQGIWQPYKDGTEYTCCDVNLFRSEDGMVAVTGDNFGRIRLFRYPCTNGMAFFKEYFAGNTPLRRIFFASGDSNLVCISGDDKLVFQYRHERNHDDDIAYQTFDRRGLLEEEDGDVSDWLVLFSGNVDGKDVIVGELQKLVTTRPWVGSIVEPSNAKDLELAPKLNARMNLVHIYGYQSQLARQAVLYNCNYELIYPVSRYVVIYNKKQNKQIFYEGHQEEVCALAVTKDGTLTASAEKVSRPIIHIWDSSSGQVITRLSTHLIHRKGILSLQFSDNKQHLISLGADEDHSIALWSSISGNWVNDSRLAAWLKGDIHPALFVTFYSYELPLPATAANSSASSNELFNSILFVSGGRFHIKFWSFTGNSLEPYYGEYSKQIKINTLLCGAQVGRSLVTGSTSGHLYVWKGRKLDRYIRAHERGITSITCFSNNQVVTASKDGIMKIWASDFQHIKSLSLAEADVPPLVSTIRSIDGIISNNSILELLVSTVSGEIFEVYVLSGRINLLLEGHYDGELRGLAVNPVNPDEFVTVGDDSTIRVWSLKHKRLLRKAVVDCTARAVDYSSNGRSLIVGLGGKADGTRQRKDGAFLMLDSQTLKPKYEGR